MESKNVSDSPNGEKRKVEDISSFASTLPSSAYLEHALPSNAVSAVARSLTELNGI